MNGLCASEYRTCQKAGGNSNCTSLQECCPSCCIYWSAQAIPCGTGIEYLFPFPSLSGVANINPVFSDFQNVCWNMKQISNSFFWWEEKKKSIIKKPLLNICRKSTSLRNKRAYSAKPGSLSKKYTFQFEVLMLSCQNIHLQLVSLNSILFPREKDLIGLKSEMAVLHSTIYLLIPKNPRQEFKWQVKHLLTS